MWLCARWLKISKIKPVRSITWRPIWRSKFRCCVGDKGWLKIANSASCSSITRFNSFAFPEPMYKAGSVLPFRAMTLAAGIEPALSAKRLSSAILSAKSSRPVSTPTRTARAASTPVLYRASFFYTEINRTSRNDRGDCMFVNHLRYGIAQ